MKIAIVGAGSAGIFTAYKLMNLNGASVDLYEKGKDITNRSRKEVMSGFGGAGAYSDGKLTLTTEFGGWLTDFIDEKELENLIEEADTIWKDVSGVDKLDSSQNYEKIKDLEYLCSRHNLRLYSAKIRHLGTDNCLLAVKNLQVMLEKSRNVNLFFECGVSDIILENNEIKGLVLENGEKRYYDIVVLAVGRSGNSWMQEIVNRYQIESAINPVDIGVRVEVPRSITDHFTDYLYEFKIKYYTSEFEDEVRTFCVNPGGFITIERNENNLLTVNGHSYKNKKSSNTNFALLVSTKFTEPFKEPVKYGQYVAYLANMLSGGSVIVQRFGDLIRGRRSTESRIRKNFVKPTLQEAMPGDLSFVLPYRYLSNLKETILQLDKVMPGMADPNTLLYGVEAKFYSLRINVDQNMRSKSIKNLYCIGDGAGITRGIIQASVSGIIAANDIIKRI
ncbi:NAD(P)/FAD-dependent oxidoreductase [Calditerrivibrio nitroreducens]|uniref:FAD dependent oxidoreductase n=1 Tax=Calditerrivibrio nitroreducens (strain DSM 19672 / NBRC 101217 / Yu37-1) TaxID=768670 RepID=E4TG74_CALNY|nr:FAD-dependent oxidoreductase [Calditerrivibrio nitroreducens]ADR19661.1 FAD dependent oxidoreductase [Calditerrivibrio nitroreducens DSM 19672]